MKTFRVHVIETTIYHGYVDVDAKDENDVENIVCEDYLKGGVCMDLDMDNDGVEFEISEKIL